MADERLEPLEDLVGDLFVDRQVELDLFWEWGMRIPNPVNSSMALVGRRRTGKTAILVKLFNRLFYAQESVLPVFISFARYLQRKKPIDAYEFAREYFTGYVGSYLAFFHRQPKVLYQRYTLEQLHAFARDIGDDFALSLFESYESNLREPIPYGVVQWVINMPMGMARERNMPTAMIIDEFQVLTNVYHPQQDLYHDLTDSFQWPADTKWAPLLVSGSAVSLLVGRALGGMLSGRFQYWYLDPLAAEYAHDLVFRLGAATDLATNEELAESIWQLTAGYPYSIYSLMTSVSPARQGYPALDALEEVMTFELTHPRGKLWQHYNEEFAKYSDLLNTTQTIKKVMFWAARYPEERIDAKRIAQEIGVDVDVVQEALHKLHRADIVSKVGWTLYEGPGDPMLRHYIEYNYRREIEELAPTEAVKDWEQEYKLPR